MPKHAVELLIACDEKLPAKKGMMINIHTPNARGTMWILPARL